MSFNKLTTADVTKINKVLKDEFKDEIKSALSDMKEYLANTKLSEEDKVKRYAEFSANITASMISECGQLSVNFVVQDAQLHSQGLVNTAQIDVFKKQSLESVQNELIKKEEVKIKQKELEVATKELDSIKFKLMLEAMKASVSSDLTVAQSLSEARKSGASVTKDVKSAVLPITGQTISYPKLTFTAASATDKTSGEIGIRMALWEKQTKTFNDHSKVQIASNLTNLAGIGLDAGVTNIAGLMNTIKTIGEDVTSIPFNSTFSTIESS